MSITFHPDGTAEALWDETIPLHQIGTLTIRRATQIEWNQSRQEWEVRFILKDGTVSGEISYSNPSRDLCLAWERHFFSA